MAQTTWRVGGRGEYEVRGNEGWPWIPPPIHRHYTIRTPSDKILEMPVNRPDKLNSSL